MLNVTVSRRRWLRGKLADKYGSALLEPESNRMCCLGFAALKAGCTRDEIRDKGTPEDLRQQLSLDGKAFPKPLLGLLTDSGRHNNVECAKLMEANDNVTRWEDDKEIVIPGHEREAKVRELGKKVGINFRFVD